MKRKASIYHPPGYWNDLEHCKQEALKYTSRNEMHNHSQCCFKAIKKNGWDDVCFAHFKKYQIGYGYWQNLDNCKRTAAMFSSLKSMNKVHPECCNVIRRNGWEHECFAHFRNYKPAKIRVKDLTEIASAYDSVKDLYEDSPEIFTRIVLANRLTEIENSMGAAHTATDDAVRMVYDYCMNVAGRYSMRHELYKEERYVYSVAHSHGWLDDICSHMLVSGNLKRRCIYSVTFSDHHAYIGLTDNFERRRQQHMNSVFSTVYRHIANTGLKPTFSKIHDYTSVEDAQRLEGLYLEEYKQNGWIMLNIAKTGGMGNNSGFTDEYLFDVSMKCDSYTEFVQEHKNIYNAARKRPDVLNVIKKILNFQPMRLYLTEEDVWNEVYICESFREFRFMHGGAHNAARKMGIVKEIRDFLPPGESIKVDSLDEALKLSSTCSSPCEFRVKSESAYYILRKHHIKYDFKTHTYEKK